MMQYWWFFFFKQKTAYEMRISDWSSDVCSSDLLHRLGGVLLRLQPVLRLHTLGHEHDGVGMRGFAKGGPLPLFLRALREADLGGDERAGIGGERAVAEIVGRPPAAHEHQGKRGDAQPAHQKPSGSASPARRSAATSVLRSRQAMFRSEEHTSELPSQMRK